MLGDGRDSAAPLRAAAQHRGLPLRLPLADLSEQLLATPEAFGANSQQTLGEASERYDADVLLAVHAREGDSGWQAQWKCGSTMVSAMARRRVKTSRRWLTR